MSRLGRRTKGSCLAKLLGLLVLLLAAVIAFFGLLTGKGTNKQASVESSSSSISRPSSSVSDKEKKSSQSKTSKQSTSLDSSDSKNTSSSNKISQGIASEDINTEASTTVTDVTESNNTTVAQDAANTTIIAGESVTTTTPADAEASAATSSGYDTYAYTAEQPAPPAGYVYAENQDLAASYGGYVLANGNTAGAVGSEAAAQMAAATGVPQSTWEYIIARESNGDPNAYNVSGASGLFQTMPGWGSTATVQDQINAAINAYNAQGLSAWGMQ